MKPINKLILSSLFVTTQLFCSQEPGVATPAESTVERSVNSRNELVITHTFNNPLSTVSRSIVIICSDGTTITKNTMRDGSKSSYNTLKNGDVFDFPTIN